MILVRPYNLRGNLDRNFDTQKKTFWFYLIQSPCFTDKEMEFPGGWYDIPWVIASDWAMFRTQVCG